MRKWPSAYDEGMTDPLTILANVPAQEIRDRLDKLEEERSALMVLLRAARARERTQRRQPLPPLPRQEVTRAK